MNRKKVKTVSIYGKIINKIKKSYTERNDLEVIIHNEID